MKAKDETEETSATRTGLTTETRGAATTQSPQTDEEPDRVGGDLQARGGQTAGGRDKASSPDVDATRGG